MVCKLTKEIGKYLRKNGFGTMIFLVEQSIFFVDRKQSFIESEHSFLFSFRKIAAIWWGIEPLLSQM